MVVEGLWLLRHRRNERKAILTGDERTVKVLYLQAGTGAEVASLKLLVLLPSSLLEVEGKRAVHLHLQSHRQLVGNIHYYWIAHQSQGLVIKGNQALVVIQREFYRANLGKYKGKAVVMMLPRVGAP